MSNVTLPAELLSLVHHIELNKAGWWSKAIQRFVMGVVWLHGDSLTADEIANELRATFDANVDPSRVKEEITKLLPANILLQLPNGRLKLSEKARTDLESEINEAHEIEARARKRFIEVFQTFCPALAPEEGWESFNKQFLLPLVREIGARTYELVSGTSLNLEATTRFPEFLSSYSPDHRQGIRDAIVRFMDPKEPSVRSYLLRHLNAYFFIQAGSLQKTAVNSLDKIAKHHPPFKVFVDTNFLFSFLSLHESPSNEAAKSHA